MGFFMFSNIDQLLTISNVVHGYIKKNKRLEFSWHCFVAKQVKTQFFFENC